MIDALLTDPAATPAQLRAALEDLAGFGLSAPPRLDKYGKPAEAAQPRMSSSRRLRSFSSSMGAAVWRKRRKRSAGPLTAEAIAEAGQAIFGDGFWILPAIAAPAAPDAWSAALAAPPAGASAPEVRRFLIDFASVRDGVRRYVESALLAEAIGGPAAPRVAQLAGALEFRPRAGSAACCRSTCRRPACQS